MIKELFLEFGFELKDETCFKFQQFSDLLLLWNEKMNLTNITDPTDIVIKHFLDSASVFKTGLIFDHSKIIDIGCGAGFPSIPMKIINEELSITMTDSLNKRLLFLNEVIKEFDFNNIRTIHARCEDLAHETTHREQYDIVTSRAVANLNTLCELSLGFLKLNGHLLALKGPKAFDELKEAKKSIEVMGGEVADVLQIKIPKSDFTHNIVLIKKVRHTPTAYPRKAPKPTKMPL